MKGCFCYFAQKSTLHFYRINEFLKKSCGRYLYVLYSNYGNVTGSVTDNDSEKFTKHPSDT